MIFLCLQEDDKYIYYDGITSFENPIYDAEYKRSIENKEEFWAEQAQELEWSEEPTKILDTSDKYLHRWFTDGKMNISHNCLDRHV